MASDIGRSAQIRLFLTLAGVGAGLCFYLLLEVLGRSAIDQHLHLFLSAFAVVFFGGLLAMAGPLSAPRAAVAALTLALPTAALTTWASLRFDDPAQLLHAPETMLASFLIVSLSLPFLIAAALPGTDWRNYSTLFAQSWSIVVRYVSAWLFAGVIWVVLMLSDALLRLDGVSIIHDLLEVTAVPYVLTGLALGFGLAVVNELADYIPPFLVLRLLRLLAPPMALVVVVFLVSLPLRGIGGLSDQVSSAGTLLAIAVAAAALVSIALDQSDAEAIESPLMLISVQALAMMLPVLAALAAWAMWLRIDQYGLTPARIAGALGTVVVMGYGLLYAVSVLMRGAWMARIRRANSVMALVVIALAVLWLTPLLNARAISARDLIARYQAGRTPAAALDLDALNGHLGRAGTAALAQLRAMAKQPDQGALRARIDIYDQRQHSTDGLARAADKAALRTRLTRLLPLRPEGRPGSAALRDAVLAHMGAVNLRNLLDGCTRPLPGGQPGCVMVIGDFLSVRPGDEALVLWHNAAGYLQASAFGQGTTGILRTLRWLNMSGTPHLYNMDGEAVLGQVLDGHFALAPPDVKALKAGAVQIILQP